MNNIVEIDSPRGLLRLRPETEADQDFRFRPFGESRPDLALMPSNAREQVLMLQFRAQNVSYRTQFPRARFDIIELEGRPIGRIVVDRPGTMWCTSSIRRCRRHVATLESAAPLCAP